MASSPPDVRAPGGFVPGQAIAFGAYDGPATAVDHTHPLPIASTVVAASSTPLTGSLSASGTAGPFAPQLGRPIWLTLSGSWSGVVQLLRSTDGGTTKLPLTYGDGSAKPVFAGAMQAPVAEETVGAATYYLAATLTAGALAYRMEQ
jgi:hypothetical protein